MSTEAPCVAGKIYVNEHGFWVCRGERGRIWAGELTWPTSCLGMTDEEMKKVDAARAKGLYPVTEKRMPE